MTKSTNPFEHVELYLKMDKFQFGKEEEDPQEKDRDPQKEDQDPQERDQEGKVERIPAEEIEDTDPLEKDSQQKEAGEPEVGDSNMFAIRDALAKEGMDIEDIDPSVLDVMKNLADGAEAPEAGDGELNPDSAKDLFTRFIDAVGGDIEQAVELMHEYLAEFGEAAVANTMKNGEKPEFPAKDGEKPEFPAEDGEKPEPSADDKVPGSERTGTAGVALPRSEEPSGESGGQGESPPGSDKLQKAGQVKLPSGEPGKSSVGKRKSSSAGAEENGDEE